MQIFRGISAVKKPFKNSVVTVGNFDGLHLGHREIIRKLKAEAATRDSTTIVVTFRPHPQIALNPKRVVELLNTYDEKLELLESVGIDVVIEEAFNSAFRNTSPENFVTEYLLKKLGAAKLFFGHDFVFGKDRKGTVELIRTLARDHGVEVVQIEPYHLDDNLISSSCIREALAEGKIVDVNRYLDRNFFIQGLVVAGAGRGRTIGIPTINLQVEERCLPKQGVYATRTRINDKWFLSVTNIGLAPTFEKTNKENISPTVETHILDFSRDVYGEFVRLEFHTFLREEQKFSGVGQLIQQIQKDIANAQSFFKS